MVKYAAVVPRPLIILALASIAWLLAMPCLAQSTWVEGGNVWFESASGVKRAVTNLGYDSEPSLSADSMRVTFVRNASVDTIPVGAGDAAANEIWISDTASPKPRRVVAARRSDDMSRVLAGLHTPMFSSDGKRIVFGSAAWAVSEAIHIVDLATTRVRLIGPGSLARVFRGADGHDYIAAARHKYFLEGGAYDFYWLMTLDGKEVGPICGDGCQIQHVLDEMMRRYPSPTPQRR